MMRKITTLLIISIFIGLALFPTVESSLSNRKYIKNFFQNEFDESIIKIDAVSPYDYGLKAGLKFRKEYVIIDFIARLMKNNNIKDDEIENQIKIMEQYCPSSLDELKGLSESLNIDLNRLVFLKSSLYYFIEERCVSVVCNGPATETGEAFLIQKRDTSGLWHKMTLMKSFLCIIERLNMRRIHIKDYGDYPMHYRYMFSGLPIINEVPLINEKGLGFGASGILLTRNESRHDMIDTGNGITEDMLWELAMKTCKNVTEVANLYKSIDIAAGICGSQVNPVKAFCDAEGRILMIENTHNYIATVFGNSTEISGNPEGVLWHANHNIWLDPNITGSVFPEECFVSEARHTRLGELLTENYGKINLDVCKEITRDHGGGFNPDKKDPADICRHTDRNGAAIEILTYIVKPKDMTVFTIHGSPCKRMYKEYNIKDILKE